MRIIINGIMTYYLWYILLTIYNKRDNVEMHKSSNSEKTIPILFRSLLM